MELWPKHELGAKLFGGKETRLYLLRGSDRKLCYMLFAAEDFS